MPRAEIISFLFFLTVHMLDYQMCAYEKYGEHENLNLENYV